MKLDRNIVEHITGFRMASASESSTNSGSNANSAANSGESLFDRLKFHRGETLDPIPQHLMRKYIAYAKQYVHPKISPEAAAMIKDYYLNLRKHHRSIDSTPVTTRQLESLVRLTEARAKAELREIATVEDARDVLEIFDFSMKGVYDDDNEITLGFTQDILNNSLREDFTPSASRSLSRNMAKRLASAIERKAESLQKNIFTVDEIKAIAVAMGVESGLERLIDVLNNDGFLIKKGPRVYQFMCVT
jgi:DNA helicase MCM8